MAARGRPARPAVAAATGLATLALAAAAAGGCGSDDGDANGPPAPRAGLIVPGSSIDRVALEMSEEQVTAALGRPAKVKRGSRAHTGDPLRTWVYPGRGLEVTLDGRTGGGHVVEVATRSPAQRTREGVRVGSTEARVARAIERAECGAGDTPSTRWCVVGDSAAGGLQTVFEVRRSRVSAVWITVVS